MKKTILIIDDSSFSRIILTDLVKKLGYSVYEASGGKEGLAKIKDLKPDAVILDLLMPDIDGLKLIEFIRKEDNIPIAVLSANKQEAVKSKCFSLGADFYCNKPISKEKIEKLLDSIIY